MLDVPRQPLPLYSFQERAAFAISEGKRVVYLAHDTGLGKTRTAIEALRRMGARRVLVVCPLTAVGVWRQQIARWWSDAPPVFHVASPAAFTGHGGETIFLVSYGLFSQASVDLSRMNGMDATVLDEAHFLKNSAANRTKSIFALKDRLGRIIPVSATPAPNHAGELWAVLRHLRPDLILIRGTSGKERPMQEWEFKARYLQVRTINVTVKGVTRYVDKIEGSKNVDELRRRLDGFFLRETKAKALPELPPMIYDTLPVGVDAEMVRGFKDVIPSNVTEDDKIIAYLRDGGGAVQRVLASIGIGKAPQVAEYVVDFLESNPREQIVVWAFHHAVIDYFTNVLGQFAAVKLDGRDNPASRKIAESRFVSGKARVFVGQIQAGGVALTLLSERPCSTVIFAEASFSPADNYQAASRVHRIGQPNSVIVRFASASGTFDERVQEILARKTDDASKLFD